MPKGGNRKPPSNPPSPEVDRFEEAITAWRRRVPMTDADYQTLDEAERASAFKVAHVNQADVVQSVFDAIDRAVRDGTTLENFKDDVGAALEGAWGGPDGHLLETVFRNNVMGAYGAGRHAIMTAPVVKRSRPYWRLDAIMDSRTSEICEELDGTVRPSDDPFWARHTPPLHHRCRTVLTPLTDEEAEDEGVSPPPDPGSSPGEGFGAAPADEGLDWEPDLSKYAPDLRRALAAKLRE